MDNLVFESLCRHSCSIMGGWYPYPTRCISECTGLSMYKVRKELHRLRDLGLVQVDRYCEVGEDGNYLICGWSVTTEGRKTDTYRRMYEEEAQRVRECFNFEMENKNDYVRIIDNEVE